MAFTPIRVAAAWHSVQDEWFVRLYDGKRLPWQVCHQAAEDDFVNPKVVASFGTQEAAEKRRNKLENEARGLAVLRALNEYRRAVKAGHGDGA